MRRFATGLVCVALFLAFHLAAQDYTAVAIRTAKDTVEVELPLTAVTSKVRVKQRTADGLGEPVAPRQTPLGASHYLEWQIGYDTPDKAAPTVAPGIVFQRRGETKYGYELSTILLEAKRLGFLDNDTLRELKKSLAARTYSLEEDDRGTLEAVRSAEVTLPDGFEKFAVKTPLCVKQTPHGGIEVLLRPRQRAVGYQAMLYVCLPMDQVLQPDGAPRRGGPAKAKERVVYRFTRDHREFLLDIARAFGLASRQHNEDLRQILEQIIAQ